MNRRTAIEYLEQIKHRIHGGDEEFDRQRKESIDMAITDMKICEANNAGWISVKDRLPKKSGKYLIVAVEQGRIHHVTTAMCGTYFHMTGRMTHWRVTHWMPLPELPKEEQNEG